MSGRTNVLHWVRSSDPVTAADIHLMLDSVYGRALLKRVRIEEDDEVRQLSCRGYRKTNLDDVVRRYGASAAMTVDELAAALRFPS